jgi:hypothetical protein
MQRRKESNSIAVPSLLNRRVLDHLMLVAMAGEDFALIIYSYAEDYFSAAERVEVTAVAVKDLYRAACVPYVNPSLPVD